MGQEERRTEGEEKEQDRTERRTGNEEEQIGEETQVSANLGNSQ